MSKTKTTKKAKTQTSSQRRSGALDDLFPPQTPRTRSATAKRSGKAEAAKDQATGDKPASAKPPKARTAAKEPASKKLSAIDAAAQVLAGANEPMNAKQMIDAMAAKGLWSSPGGKTPHATLYSAILREVATKGEDARFVKSDRGKFAASARA